MLNIGAIAKMPLTKRETMPILVLGAEVVAVISNLKSIIPKNQRVASYSLILRDLIAIAGLPL
jgi:hypothetical protein